LRTAKLEIAILISLNLACSAIPLFPLRVDDEAAAAMIFAYGGTIALLALLYGIAFTIVFGVRRQKWAATALSVLACTPFLACIAVAQLVAGARLLG
jgi:hypothetical protein